jgi:hypothetical protein
MASAVGRFTLRGGAEVGFEVNLSSILVQMIDAGIPVSIYSAAALTLRVNFQGSFSACGAA